MSFRCDGIRELPSKRIGLSRHAVRIGAISEVYLVDELFLRNLVGMASSNVLPLHLFRYTRIAINSDVPTGEETGRRLSMILKKNPQAGFTEELMPGDS